jgi:hypothetical protein
MLALLAGRGLGDSEDVGGDNGEPNVLVGAAEEYSWRRRVQQPYWLAR